MKKTLLFTALVAAFAFAAEIEVGENTPNSEQGFPFGC